MASSDIYDGDETKKEFIKRLFACFLDVIIIAHFQQEPFSGYDVLQFAHKKLEILLSPGTIYSTLYNMERGNLIVGFNGPNKRIYKVTEKGLHMAELASSPQELSAFFAAVSKK